MRKLKENLSYSNVIATLALVLAVGTGGAYAANLIDSKDIAKSAVLSKHVKNGQLSSKDLKDGKGVKAADIVAGTIGAEQIADGSVGAGEIADGSINSGKVVDGSLAANDLVAEEKFHLVGATGEPGFLNGGDGDCTWSNANDQPGIDGLNPVGFRRDRFGEIHLMGVAGSTEHPGVNDEECGSTSPEPDDTVDDGVVFTLPAAYRPANSAIFPSGAGGGSAVLIVGPLPFDLSPTQEFPPGAVVGGLGTGTTAVTFDGISYQAADTSLIPARAKASGRSAGADSSAIKDLLTGEG
jgi:hypothetical protein